MRRYTIALLTAAGLLAGAGIALAQSGQPEISFPIAELGGCNSKAECKAYCDDSTHAEACLSFAESRGMMSKDEIKTARKFIVLQQQRALCRVPRLCREERPYPAARRTARRSEDQ